MKLDRRAASEATKFTSLFAGLVVGVVVVFWIVCFLTGLLVHHIGAWAFVILVVALGVVLVSLWMAGYRDELDRRRGRHP
jgi:hypothetical protein